MTNSSYNTHTKPLLKKSRILTSHDMHKLHIDKFTRTTSCQIVFQTCLNTITKFIPIAHDKETNHTLQIEIEMQWQEVHLFTRAPNYGSIFFSLV